MLGVNLSCTDDIIPQLLALLDAPSVISLEHWDNELDSPVDELSEETIYCLHAGSPQVRIIGAVDFIHLCKAVRRFAVSGMKKALYRFLPSSPNTAAIISSIYEIDCYFPLYTNGFILLEVGEYNLITNNSEIFFTDWLRNRRRCNRLKSEGSYYIQDTLGTLYDG